MPHAVHLFELVHVCILRQEVSPRLTAGNEGPFHTISIGEMKGTRQKEEDVMGFELVVVENIDGFVVKEARTEHHGYVNQRILQVFK